MANLNVMGFQDKSPGATFRAERIYETTALQPLVFSNMRFIKNYIIGGDFLCNGDYPNKTPECQHVSALNMF